MTTSPIPPFPAEELLLQAEEKKRQAAEASAREDYNLAAELSRQAEELEQTANLEATPTTTTPPDHLEQPQSVGGQALPHTTPRSASPTVRPAVVKKAGNFKYPLALIVFCAVASGILVWTFWPATSPTQPESTATEPAKTQLAKPPAKPAVAKKAETKTATIASSQSFVSELQKLRGEIEGLKNRFSAVQARPAAPTINFPPEIAVRLVQSPQDGSQQTKGQGQPTQPEHYQLSDEERARRGWEQYQRSYNQP